MYFDERHVRELLQKLLSYSRAEQTEVLYLGVESALTRFANNYIHQNVAENNAELRVRAVVGKRVGVASTNRLDDESLRRVAEQALEIARLQPENPEFRSLPSPTPLSFGLAYSARTASFTPEERAQSVGTIIRLARERKLEAAGAFSTDVNYVAVANSLGIFAYEARTDSECHVVVMADEQGSGYAQRGNIDASTINFEAMAREAVEKALRSRNPIECPIGEYQVVLDTYAMAEMLQNLALMGISALAVQEERSFMNGQSGKQLVSPLVTLRDDAYNPLSQVCSFDYEGVPKQRVTVFERGIVRDTVYDSFTALRAGVSNTGHALPAPNSEGPLPLNLVMEAGDSNLEDLIRGIGHGIYVTRFHYTNPVHPIRTLLTGMTRNGTFLIKNGELAQPVKNFRFTQSILGALQGVQALSRERLQWREYLPIVAPAARLESFNFTGVTG